MSGFNRVPLIFQPNLLCWLSFIVPFNPCVGKHGVTLWNPSRGRAPRQGGTFDFSTQFLCTLSFVAAVDHIQDISTASWEVAKRVLHGSTCYRFKVGKPHPLMSRAGRATRLLVVRQRACATLAAVSAHLEQRYSFFYIGALALLRY